MATTNQIQLLELPLDVDVTVVGAAKRVVAGVVVCTEIVVCSTTVVCTEIVVCGGAVVVGGAVVSGGLVTGGLVDSGGAVVVGAPVVVDAPVVVVWPGVDDGRVGRLPAVVVAPATVVGDTDGGRDPPDPHAPSRTRTNTTAATHNPRGLLTG